MEPPQPATQPVAPNPVQSDMRQRARDAEAMAAALAGASAVKKLTLSQNSQQQTADRARMREEAEAHTSAQLLVCPMCMKVYERIRKHKWYDLHVEICKARAERYKVSEEAPELVHIVATQREDAATEDTALETITVRSQHELQLLLLHIQWEPGMMAAKVHPSCLRLDVHMLLAPGHVLMGVVRPTAALASAWRARGGGPHPAQTVPALVAAIEAANHKNPEPDAFPLAPTFRKPPTPPSERGWATEIPQTTSYNPPEEVEDVLQAEYDENPKVTAKKLEQHLVETFPDNEEWRHRTVDIQTCLDKYWKELQKLRQTGGPRGCAAVVCTLERHTLWEIRQNMVLRDSLLVETAG